MRKSFISAASIILWIAVIITQANAQQNASISGFVTDEKTGEPLPGATVQIASTTTGDATDKNGYYKISNISTGTYTVRVSFVGYQPQTKYNVVVKSGSNPDINFSLKPIVQELDNITISPDPYQKPAENPLSRKELSQVQITSYPGGNNDIAKVVQSLPGVSSSVGSFRNDIIIRGGGPSENVYYLDGIEIPVINHFATQGSAGGPVGLLNVSFFENVNLSTSSFPARYGNVLSGVLQFDQRNGNAQNIAANTRIGASEAALTVEGPLFKDDDETYSNTTFIASVRRSYLQLLFQLIDLPFLPDYWDYQYKLNHKISNTDEINITGVGSIDDFRINKPDNITAEQQATLDKIPIIKQNSTTHGISWKHRFENYDGFLETSLSTSIFNNDLRRYRDNENKQGLLQSTNSREWLSTLRSRYNHFIGKWKLAGGIETKRVSYSARTFRSRNNVNFNTDFNFLRYGLFSQISTEWNTRLSTSLGIRADANTFTKSSTLWETISPRIALSFDLDPNNQWTVNASAGRYYKLPPATLLGYQNGGSFVNKNVEYIRSDHYVAGVSYQPRQSTQFSLEGFLKQYSDYPVSVTDSVSLANLGTNFDVFGNENVQSIGRGRAYGFEFTYQQKLQDNFYTILAYTLYWSKFSGLNNNQYLPSVWDNRHLLTFTGGYKLKQNWEIGTRLRISGGSPYASINRSATENQYPILVFDYSTLDSNRLDPFISLDIRVDKKWNFRKWALNVYLEVTNILGSEIPTPPEYGLKRNQSGDPVSPNQLVQIMAPDNSAALPTLGIVIDI
ncbi:TonB-dependent Receptor Plug Domain [Fodinibius salinus]|uniref:TonB-dependent Receptor Plug Domain n=1 Tax=Fodinibius salinus TaxID=860790 RepID=A0A5D3YKE2_9BACT|nr:TonB-dependent receptor [Fodinibius salinus]TYP93426.1 TonB-dependent Receptor Plug Domain [Fodinibius salinus]